MKILDYSDRDKYVEVEKFKILIANLSSSMPATISNSLILIFVLWNAISHTTLLIWAGLNSAFVVFRYIIIHIFIKNSELKNLIFWKRALIVSFAIAGTLFGSSGIFLINPKHIEYVVFLYLVTGGMVAGSVGVYHNNLMVHFIYSGSVFIIPTTAIYLIKSEISMPMVILGFIFYAVTSISAIRLNRDLKDFLLLRYDNIELVERLNQEKQNTERLNEELIHKNEILKELSLADPLTGLKNRRYLFEIFTPEAEALVKDLGLKKMDKNKRSQNENKGYGVFVIDIDFFKQVNDNFGHDAGDRVLKQFSRQLELIVREDDIVGRLGGEEFIIILKDTQKDHLDVLADKIRTHIENYTFSVTPKKTVKITCSIGTVFYPFIEYHPELVPFGQALTLADKALYFSKDNGRNMAAKADIPGASNPSPDTLDAIYHDINFAISNNHIVFTPISKGQIKNQS